LTPPSPSNDTVLGIDPGSHVTGYAFLDRHEGLIRILEYGTIKCRAQDSLPDRLLMIVQQLEQRIQLYHPQRLCIESAFFAKNAHSALVLGHVRGAIMVLCRSHSMSITESSPREIKQAVTGNGAASKERVARMVCHLLRIDQIEGTTDASDALAIAWTSLNPIGQLTALESMPRATPKKSHAASPPPQDKILASSKRSSSHIATALPAGTDSRAFLLAHTGKNKKRR